MKRAVTILGPVVALAAAGAAALHGRPVPLVNPGFEDLYKAGEPSISATLSDDAWTRGVGPNVMVHGGIEHFGYGEAYYADGTKGRQVGVSGYTSAGFVGVQDPSPSQFTDKPDGDYILFVNGSGYSGNGEPVVQALAGVTLQPRTTYTLSIQVGDRLDIDTTALPVSLDLAAGSTVLSPSSSASPPLRDGAFVTYTRTYVTGDVAAPGELSIRFGAGPSGKQTDFDNLALDATPLDDPPYLVADANGDGRADVTDLGILATNFNQSPVSFGRAGGDFNLDGSVDVGDLGLLATYFGQPDGGAGAAGFFQSLAAYPELQSAVPEPTAAALAGPVLMFALRRQRRRR